jgi:hypothetical protein
MEKFAEPGDFCPKEACPQYGKLRNCQQQNIKKAGKTKIGVQRYQCKSYKVSFTETTGTIFFRKPTAEHKSLETLALLAEGNRLSTLFSCQRVRGRHDPAMASGGGGACRTTGSGADE